MFLGILEVHLIESFPGPIREEENSGCHTCWQLEAEGVLFILRVAGSYLDLDIGSG